MPLLLATALAQAAVQPVSNPTLRGAFAPEEGISLSVPEKQPERSLRIGDSVPALSVSEWIADGTPQPPKDGFQPGTAYVLVFFSPNQRPIKNLFDSVSNLSDRFRDRLVRVIGVAGASKGVARSDLSTVLDAYKHYVRFPIAWDEATKTRDAYLTAMGGHKEPLVVVIDPKGRLAWYGVPGQTTQILNAILADQWNLDAVRQQTEHTEDLGWLRIEIVRAQRAKDPKRMLAAGEKLREVCSHLGDEDRAEMLGFANDVSGRNTVFDLAAHKDLAHLARTLAEQAVSDQEDEPRNLAIVARARFADSDVDGARAAARRALEILGGKSPTDNDLLDEIKRDYDRFSR
ncbi:MAG: hypothetical protein K2Y21_07935 [Phycisphaerales bacterium]|nr:hypothetical protein [Phycisphaerales bacterium]